MSTDVAQVLPSAVTHKTLPLKTGDEETEYDVVAYDQLHALLIEAVKELSARVKELEMALTGSGELKFSQMRDEFNGSGQVKFSDLYRGGNLVRAANNASTNLAASVPTSGEIQVADFYSAAKGFRLPSSGATDQDASDLFGDDYGVDYPKEIVINSGVELGATSTSQEALQIDSGMSGNMTITNNGTLTGAGGCCNGGAGGDAFEADVTCTLVNNGTIRAGGGGGGAGGSGGSGGTGGGGSYQTNGPHGL